MRIHDTLTGKKTELDTAGTVRIYLCGVTVYDEAHVGHARTVVIFDTLSRYLEYRGVPVKLVQNFTDVDDKIIARAAEEGRSADDLSAEYIARYLEDSDALNVRRADAYPRATDHIHYMQELIRSLLVSDAAYVAANGVYFAVSHFPRYGRLSGKKIGDLRAGARVAIDEQKRDPLDFALWKFADSEPSWESPWGRGRPGWHIECSAMSRKHLGGSIEIHGGGRDLIFPHHENEIAQSEASSQETLAKLWMHVGMVTFGGQKMSKSLGNVRSIKRALAEWGPNVIRLFCLSGHYAKPVDYSEGSLTELASLWRQAETAYYELAHAARDARGEARSAHMDRFSDALDDDVNTHLALEEFFGLVKKANASASGRGFAEEQAGCMLRDFETMAGVLGLRVRTVDGRRADEIKEMVARRDDLRASDAYAEADRIRDDLLRDGIELIDHKFGTVWIARDLQHHGST